MIDVRNQLDRYAAPDKVDWHLACINNRWSKRALASAGFGYPTPSNSDGHPFEPWKPIFSVAEVGGADSAATAAGYLENQKELKRQRTKDLEEGRTTSTAGTDQKDAISHVSQQRHADAASSSSGSDLGKELHSSQAYKGSTGGRIAVVQSLNKPLFHVDLTSALQSAITNVELRRDGAKGI